MRDFFKNITIIKKITLSFALIITVFAGIVMVNIYHNTAVSARQDYRAYYLQERNRILLDIQNEFTELTFNVMGTLNNAAWLAAAGPDSVAEFHGRIDRSVAALIGLGEEYKRSLFADEYINDILGFDAVRAEADSMGDLMAHVRGIDSYFRIPQDGAGLQIEPFQLITERNARPAIESLAALMDMNVLATTILNEILYDQQERLLEFNIVALFVTVLLVFMILSPIIGNLKKQMRQIEEKSQAIKRGDFSVSLNLNTEGEIGRLSRVMEDVTDAFRGVMGQVIKTAVDVSGGKLDSRMDESEFEGEFRAAAACVNMLAEKFMQAAAEKAEEEYSGYVQFIMDTVPVSICFWDEGRKIINCNSETAKILGISDKQEFIDRLFEFSPPVQPGGAPSAEMSKFHLDEAFSKGAAEFEWTHRDRAGNYIPVYVRYYRCSLMSKTVVISYATDMRDFHKAVKEAERSALAEENSQAKSRFLAHMSHEIRTPINAVLGISEIQLQSASLSAPVEEAFAKIYSSAQGLLSIINDILDLSKIEAGKMEIIEADYQSAGLINDIVQLNLLRIGSKSIKFEVDIDSQMPAVLLGDELRIKQVVSNLLSNAFKYTQEGKVTLSAKFQEGEGGAGFLRFRVADTGCGMSEDELKVLFEEFARINEGRHRKVEGTGLGMAIVDRLVRLMGVKMEISSAVGVGTEIDLEIPQRRASQEAVPAELLERLKNFDAAGILAVKKNPPAPRPVGGKALVVDDVDVNLYVAEGLLSFYGMDVETCDSGVKAVELVKNGGVYDIIFMDHMMPVMDGMEAVRIMREAGYEKPIVALTANALTGQAELFMQNGFDAFISKPIDSSRLSAVLTKFIRQGPPESREPHGGVSPDDNLPGRGDTGPESDLTMRGEFAKSQKNVVSEIKLALLRGDRATCQRVVQQLKEISRMIREGDLADAAGDLEIFLRKRERDGFEAAGPLIDRLQSELELAIWRVNAEQRQQPAGESSGLGKFERVKGLNLKEGLYKFADRQDLYEKSLKAAVGEIEMCESNMSAAFAQGDMVNFSIALHGLKSGLANLGARELSARAWDLEVAAYNEDALFCSQKLPSFLQDVGALRLDLAECFAGDSAAEGSSKWPLPQEKRALSWQEVQSEMLPVLKNLREALGSPDFPNIKKGLENLNALNPHGYLKHEIEKINNAAAFMDFDYAMEILESLAREIKQG